MKAQPDTLLVFSCDHGYFPLAKGLVLSIIEESLPGEIGLAFIDIGCEASDVDWLRQAGVSVRALDTAIMGRLASPDFGYQRSQTCRPFLPKLFPQAEVLVWVDCDAWVQDTSIFPYLRSGVSLSRHRLFVAPEWHYSYTKINGNSSRRHEEMYSYYEPTFGAAVAEQMCRRPTLNSGVFAMGAGNPIWLEWESAVRRLYLQEFDRFDRRVRHMAEQIALNVVASRAPDVALLDPLYNYMSLWTPPYRDSQGIVRVALPPNLPVGIVHLAGGWKHLGKMYFEKGLLHDRGNYLTEADKRILFPQQPNADFR